MMQETVLHNIVRDKEIWLVARKLQQPLASFQHDVTPSERSFIRLCAVITVYLSWNVKRRRPPKG